MKTKLLPKRLLPLLASACGVAFAASAASATGTAPTPASSTTIATTPLALQLFSSQNP